MAAPKGNKNAVGNKGGAPKAPLDLTEKQLGIITEMFKEGCSPTEVMAYIIEVRGTFSKKLYQRWSKEEIEFVTTIAHGMIYYQAWWEQEGRRNLKNKDFNYNGWYQQMKNRFRDDWKDKSEVENTGVQVVEVRKRIIGADKSSEQNDNA